MGALVELPQEQSRWAQDSPRHRATVLFAGWSPFDRQDFLLHFGLERASPPESLIPSAPKECAVSVHPDVFASLCGTGGSMYDFWSITFLGAATGLRLVSALGCHLHERGRGWPPFRAP